jgi:hypothetical protein
MEEIAVIFHVKRHHLSSYWLDGSRITGGSSRFYGMKEFSPIYASMYLYHKPSI